MSNNNLKKLLPSTWYFVVFVALLSFIFGEIISTLDIKSPELMSGLISLYSIGVIWGGLVVGYQIKNNQDSKRK